MELKLKAWYMAWESRVSSNRTFMELKPENGSASIQSTSF